MAGDNQSDILIAVYLFEDLATRDYEALMDLAGDKKITVQGVVLATKSADGTMAVKERGDHLVRKGAAVMGGAGLVVGLFLPPVLAATAVGAGAGALVGLFTKHRIESGIENKLKDVLSDGTAALIAIYDHDDADTVHNAIPNAIKTSVATIEGHRIAELKAGLQKAQAGIGA